MKELITRTVSGLIYAAVMIGSITIHPLLFLVVFLFILILGMIEFYRMCSMTGSIPMKVSGISSGVILFLSIFLIRYAGMNSQILLLVPASMLILMILPMFRQNDNPIFSASLTFLGILYVSLPIAVFNLLIYHPYKEGFDYQVVLFLFLILWLNDTGAYITGKLIGKHKMFPRISPKKSWEGIAGGLLVAFLTTWLSRPLFPDIPYWHLWILCPVIVITGTFGDLVESSWKRSAGVKDSGRLMPGHGGILDRFDSLILAAPSAYLTINLLT
ncbi:MAG: phosphatidate cytidylyltransferase [Bacteroidia bacterium]|nr:phosphatidate cytidylyltransferase [Bacteroidia bacterium]